MNYLDLRAVLIKRSLIEVKIPWYHPFEHLRSLMRATTMGWPTQRAYANVLGLQCDRKGMAA